MSIGWENIGCPFMVDSSICSICWYCDDLTVILWMMCRCLVFSHENVHLHLRRVSSHNTGCVSNDLCLILMVLGSPTLPWVKFVLYISDRCHFAVFFASKCVNWEQRFIRSLLTQHAMDDAAEDSCPLLLGKKHTAATPWGRHVGGMC